MVDEQKKRQESAVVPVVAEYDRVSGGHDDCLESEELALLIRDVVMGRA